MENLFNPHNNLWLQNKYSYYKILRERSSLYWSDKYTLYPITRYSDVVFALNTPEIFASTNGNLIREFPSRIGKTLATNDEPKHSELKALIKEGYSKDNVERVMHSVVEYTSSILSNNKVIDFSELSLKITSWLSLEILNIPYNKHHIHSLLLGMLKNSDKSISSEFYTTNDNDLLALNKILNELILSKTPATGPGVYAEYIKNCDLYKHGLFFFTAAIFPGGTSTAGALQFLLYDLAHNVEARQAVINDPKLARNAVAESLRYNTATSRFLRTVKQPVEIQNTLIPAETRVAVCLDSANRDPEHWDTPDVFDIYRNNSKSISFGHGMHTCIAQVITREVLISVLNLFLSKFPDYTIIPDSSEFEYLMTAPGNFDFVTNLQIIRP